MFKVSQLKYHLHENHSLCLGRCMAPCCHPCGAAVAGHAARYTARGHNLRFLPTPRSETEKASHLAARRQVRPLLRRSVMFIVVSSLRTPDPPHGFWGSVESS